MALVILVSMKKTNHLEKGFINGKMMKVMKEIGRTDFSMEKVSRNYLMVQYSMVIGTLVFLKAQEFVGTQMVQDTRVNGVRGNHMVWVKKRCQMELLLMEGGKIARQKVMESKYYLTEPFLKVTGRNQSF